MDLLVRFWAVVLFLAGVPFFAGLAVAFGTMTFLEAPNNPNDFIPKFLQLYIVFAVAGLLTASGCATWAITKMAYPLKETRKELPREN
jgi:hypothetical protein